jgi:hypothetical protein
MSPEWKQEARALSVKLAYRGRYDGETENGQPNAEYWRRMGAERDRAAIMLREAAKND